MSEIEDDRFDLNLPSYEWRRVSLFGESDSEYEKKLSDAGWRPVPPDRFPNLKSSDPDVIVIDGMGLFERPLILTESARARVYRTSVGMLHWKLQSLKKTPEGHFQRVLATIGRAQDDGREPKKYARDFSMRLIETIMDSLTAPEIEIARHCALTPEQYALAKLQLIRAGEIK